MASSLAGTFNNQTCIEIELLTISLALALKKGDAERFLLIYDNFIPISCGTEKVKQIKERARELSEKSTEELEVLRSDLQAGRKLVYSVFQNVKLNGFTSGQTNTSRKAVSLSGSVGRNHNHSRHLGLSPDTPAMTLKTDEREETSLQVKEGDLGAIKAGGNEVKVKSSDTQQRHVGTDATPTDDNAIFDGTVGSARGQPLRTEQVHGKIQFGISSLQKLTEKPNSVIPTKGGISGKRKDRALSGTEGGKKDNGPFPADLLLEKSVGLVGKPKDSDIKNCPPAELIHPNQVTNHASDEVTHIVHLKSPLKRHGEHQKEVEVQNVFVNPTVYNFDSAEQQCSGVCNSGCFPGFQGSQAPCNMQDLSTSRVSRDLATLGEGTRKKKRKKKKKTKQGDNGTESTTEGEEVRSPPNGLNPPVSAEQTATKRKTSAESTSEKEDLSGENEAKVFPVQRGKQSKDNVKDKGKRTKAVEEEKRKKAEMKKKKEQDYVSTEGKRRSETDASTRQLPKEDDDEEQDKSELGEDVFLGRRTRPDKDVDSFSKHESEPDCRAAMSDPGENDDGHGVFNVVKNRRSRRKEKFVSNYFSNFGRGRDPAWDLRKSSSLPKEMCHYTSGRRRLGTNETEEFVSTTTTTTTTASSRRDSLESDENSHYDQKKQTGSSYASRLKANIHGSGNVQSVKEKDCLDNPEGTTAPSGQVSVKPNMNSVPEIESETLDHRTLLTSQEIVTNVPSSSISTAMNLDVTASVMKFDLNFPNLTPSVASGSKGGRSSDNRTESVQYLDLEYTKNSYAGRVKRSLGNSNNRAISASREDSGASTSERKSQAEGSLTSNSSYSVHKESKLGIFNSGSIHEETGDKNSHNLPVDNLRGDSCGTMEGTSEKHCRAEGISSQANDKETTVSRVDSQLLPSNAGVPRSNPIWFGSLIVSDDGILVLGESGQADSLTETTAKPSSALVGQNPLKEVGKQSDGSHEGQTDKPSTEQVTLSKGEEIAPRGKPALDNAVGAVELFSAKNVKIDVSGMWLESRTFNLGEVTEMLLKDWEATMKQSGDCPESVCFASD